MPLTTDAYCFAANWVVSVFRPWKTGDVGACCYQLDIVRKKLAR